MRENERERKKRERQLCYGNNEDKRNDKVQMDGKSKPYKNLFKYTKLQMYINLIRRKQDLLEYL